jgi:hypothetical protein
MPAALAIESLIAGLHLGGYAGWTSGALSIVYAIVSGTPILWNPVSR